MKHKYSTNTIGLLYLVIILVAIFYPNTSTAQKKVKPLFNLGANEFFADEFEYYFSKNNDKLVQDSVNFKVNEYLELYVKFRLKVLNAEAKNMHEDEAFITEFGGYKKQLAKPYLLESKMSDALIEEVYARMKEEISASHILFKVSENALPNDTLVVYNKILNVRNQIMAGANFDSLAQIISEDPSAKQNKGNLGYFSTMAMVYQFEDAAFSTPVGSVSRPVRTKFGYHIIQVKDRRNAKGKVKAAHIMLRHKKPKEAEEVQNNEAKINTIYKKILDGESWNELCTLYSDDLNTKKIGGVLNWFGTGSLVKPFENAAFGLENIGDISQPFRTKYGWHIVKLIDKKPIEPLDEIRSQLESKISRDARSKVKKEKALKILKSQNGFKIDETIKNTLSEAFDSTLLQGKWQVDSTRFKNNTLFSIQNINYSTRDFASFIKKEQRKRRDISIFEYVEYLYNQFEEKSIFDFEEKSLEESNTEYRMILQEYRNGILLFNLMEKEVWGKAIKDTLGQANYYKNNIENYKKKESAEVRILVSGKRETIEKAKAHLTKSKNEIDKAFNAEEPLNLQVFDKTVEKGEDADVDKYWEVGIYEFEKDNRFYLLKNQQIVPERYKKLDEIKGQVISDYQNYLEENWIKDLKSKYPVKINKSTLKKVIEKIENQQ